MGFFTFAVAGGGFMLIGLWEAFCSSSSSLNRNSNPSSGLNSVQVDKHSTVLKAKPIPSSSYFFYISICVMSLVFVLNSAISLFDSFKSSDRVGSAVQLQVLAIDSLFLLYSVMGLLMNFENLIPLPSSIHSLIALFAFVEEFLLFYLQRKDTSGIENRYFDLLLVPITVCIFSTIMELKSPKSNYTNLARGIGLISQGTWFLQMGFSFYTNMIAQGCSLHEKSRGNYTVKCKGHMEYHRARAIATLQFNCHLAFLVVLVVGVYSIVAGRNGGHSDFTQVKPLVEELRQVENHSQFTLDSDDDVIEEIKEDSNAVAHKRAAVELSVNGHGSNQ